MKRIFFLGDTLDQIRSFPLKARSEAGSELRRVQMGRDAAGGFRAFYVLLSAEAIYVLNAFHKKTQKTPKHELELAARRQKLI